MNDLSSTTMKIEYVIPGRQQAPVVLEVASTSDLIQLLEDIRQEYLTSLDQPIGVDIVAQDGSYLSVGLGAVESILIFFPACETERIRYSLGDACTTGTVVFYFCQWTELSKKYAIPWKTALLAVQDWCESQTLSDRIAWTDKVYPAS